MSCSTGAFISAMPIRPRVGLAGVLASRVTRALSPGMYVRPVPQAALRVGAPNGDSRPQDRGIKRRPWIDTQPLLATGLGPSAPRPSVRRAAQENAERLAFLERIGPGRGPNRRYAGDVCEGPAAKLLHTLRARWLERELRLASGKPLPPLTRELERMFDRLVQEIRACDDAYYGESPTQRIRDEEYDELIVHLIELERLYPSLEKPDSPSKVVGHAAATKATLPKEDLLGPITTATVLSQRFPPYRHVTRMLSLANAYTPADITAFLTRVSKAARELASSGSEAQNDRGEDDETDERQDSSSVTEFCVEAKVDGVALGLSYRSGVLVRAATRGDGVVGDDVTENVRTALIGRGVPEKLPETVDVDIRGEVYIAPSDFRRLDAEQFGRFANARNAAAGGLKHKDPEEAAKRLLRFVGYECLRIPEELAGDASHPAPLKRPTGSARGDEESWSELDGRLSVRSFWPTQVETIEGLAAWGFGAMSVFKVCRTENEISAFALEKERERRHLPFDADGVVVKVNDSFVREEMGNTSKSPRGAIALKFTAVSAETVVESVSYQVSRAGTITPVANLAPVSLGGVTVQRATLHNFDEIARLNVALQDVVVVERGGDVIPKIVEVARAAEAGTRVPIEIPKSCPSCSSAVKVKKMANGCTSVICQNAEKCTGQSLARILHFCGRDAMDISGLGLKTASKLMDSGAVVRPSDLFSVPLESLERLPGFARKSAESLYAAISEASTSRSLERLVVALGIPGVGRSSARALALHVGSIRGLLNMAESHAEKFMEIPNFAEKSASAIQAHLAESWVKQELEALDMVVSPNAVVDNPQQPEVSWDSDLNRRSDGPCSSASAVRGKTFAFTGTMINMVRPAAMKQIRKLGGKVVSAVSKKTDFVVVGASPGLKYQKAVRLGVRTLPEDDFLRLLETATPHPETAPAVKVSRDV